VIADFTITFSLETDVLQQERIEAELIAARLFRFRARRGLGVFYSLVSIIPLIGLILYATVPPFLAITGVIACSLTIWFIASACGFGGFSKMQYSLDFLRGQKGAIYDEKQDRRLSWRSTSTWFFAIFWPWIGYSIANAEGYPLLAAVFLVILAAELALIRTFARSAKAEDLILERRVEDWAMALGPVLIGITAILPGAPGWTWALASPLYVVCGTKSLYDAPRELALVAS
jgi:hypothetical protein